MTPSEQIKTALQYLAGVCDFAATLDGAGFNKFDAGFGHELAEQSYPLTDEQNKAAFKMLRKYRHQIEAAGLTLPEDGNIPSEPKTDKMTEAKLLFGQIFVTFPSRPSADILDIIKNIEGRRWHPEMENTPWSVPATVKNVEIISSLPRISIDPQVTNLQNAIPTIPVEQPKPVSVIKAQLTDGKIIVTFPYSADKVAAIKTLVERRYSPVSKAWEIPTRLLTDLVAMFPSIELDAYLHTMLNDHKELKIKSNSANGTIEVKGLNGLLMPFQKAGVEFIELANGRCIIADAMGLGKTIQAIAWMQLHPEKRPAIYICPASLKINVLREIEKWMPAPNAEILTGTKPYETDAAILIINYDILSYWLDHPAFQKPSLVIADEAHFAKNRKAQRTQAVKELTKRAQHVLLMTGTPVVNRPIELFGLLNMVDDKAWPNFIRYAIQYCGAYKDTFGWNFSGATHLDELHQAIKTIVVRRTKDQVLKELPAKRRAIVPVTFDEKERTEYNRILAETIKMIEEGGKQAAVLTQIELLKQAAVKGKMRSIIEWISNMLEGDKLVIFCTHTVTVNSLMEKFGDVAVKVTGEVSQTERQNNVDKFQNDPECKLFVGNLKAAGVGLTLTAASDVAFAELGWSPGDMEQGSDRVHRIGQHDAVTAWYLVAAGTIEEKIAELLDSKQKVIDKIHDGIEADETTLITALLEEILKSEKI